MTAIALKTLCHEFVEAAGPYLNINEHTRYIEAIQLVEVLLEEVDDSKNDPLHKIIDVLTQSIHEYENRDQHLAAFEQRVSKESAERAVLRVLMDQHHLTMNDFPEIGSKSMVSRVLSGQRNLTKKHIEALCQRFHISPLLFFNRMQ